ncbi:hypothetical protein OH76DRAFT_1439000 [Lentinus brumalis]|uniref:Cyclin N-terminal domain-containing protein n=1 Tax=Lentinus brumalis TaxID=2498619 RepID=A0A371D9T1_9APHY|nr:hypothetical protein OH76DRAFT_1439000 [Polyporus brumalis]
MSASSAPRHPSSSRRQPGSSSHPSGSRSSRIVGPWYGYEEPAKLCSRFLTHLFACPDLPPLSTAVPPAPTPPLANFIAYALYRTKLHASVTFGALYLLQRLKARFPAARGSSGHRLFISAYMIASKMICDDTYSNKSWSIVGQGMFALREINQMEREMCSFLEWELNIEHDALKEFEQKVRRDFTGLGPYPSYVHPSPVPAPMPSTTPYNAQTGNTAHAPSFSARSQQPPSRSPPKRIPPPTPLRARLPPSLSSRNPGTPSTPDLCRSTTTSPASSASPSTPQGYADYSIQVVSTGQLGTPVNHTSASPVNVAIQFTSNGPPLASIYAPQQRVLHRPRETGNFIARANPCVW